MTIPTDVKYETRSVKAVRGLEARTRAKLEKEGWEFVSQVQGTVRSELNFRRPKPEIPWKLIGIGGGLSALVLVVLLITGALGGGDSSSTGADGLQSAAPSEIAPAPSEAPPAEAIAQTPPEATPTEAITQTVEPTPATLEITDTTVDELLDRLNSDQMGGIEVGDQFRLTGELFMSHLWMTGATGEFNVLLKAQGGTQDLMVFVDESEAAEWQDGTKVQMTVEMGEATINGETTDGWLRALSVETIP